MGQIAPRPRMPVAPLLMQRVIEHGNLTWIDIMDPSREQVQALREHYGFHPLHCDDVLSHLQRPKIDDSQEPQYLFLILHLPVFDEMLRLSTVAELDMFVGPSYVITCHDARLRPLKRLVQATEKDAERERLMSRGPGYLLYTILHTLIDACFSMLGKLDDKLDRLEVDIFRADARRLVEELSYLRRDIISLRRIVRPNIPVLNSLTNRDRPFLRLDEDVYFGDLVDSLARVWDMLEEQKEIIEGLDATLFSLTSHRINTEMKIFTLISVIVLPMTLLASILGMNVFLGGWAESRYALPAILILMGVMGIGLYLYFRHKRYV
jgi:magnesium transporter